MAILFRMAIALSVDVPEPFRTALAKSDCAPVCELEVQGSLEAFGRGLARASLGRYADARLDLEQAQADLGDVCRVELALLDLQSRHGLTEALQVAEKVAQGADSARLAARAWHVVGLAHGKLRHTAKAIEALLKSSELYTQIDERLGLAQVRDTLGMVEAARGRLDFALHAYALSLVDKTLLGDRAGMAITLGNLGRIHLRAGRYADALACFQRDLELSQQLNDVRGQARMREDLGQVYFGQENFARAEQELHAALALCAEHGIADIEFFAHKDLARLRIAQQRFAEAEKAIESAERVLPPAAEASARLCLTATRGALFAARSDARALATLEEAVRGFQKLELPDFEIPARIDLARALAGQKFKAQAEHCLLEGLRRARLGGYTRYLSRLNEAMAELAVVEGMMEEPYRPIVGPAAGGDEEPVLAAGAHYVLLDRLGGGAFGEVFRVYDPDRNSELAIKQLRFDRLYDVEERQQLLASARIELEAASRVRHPGVLRVYALGADPSGGAYLVEDYVAGKSLRHVLPRDARASVCHALPCLALIADALAALHAVGVVHRDLKPENILIRGDGTPVLVDFGIAQVAGRSGIEGRGIAGTLAYMAPEQAAGKKIDGRGDLYALGAIAYEWLTGLLPLRLRGTTLDEQIRDLAKREPAPLADFRADLPPALQKLVMQLLAKKPARRPPTALAVAEQFHQLAADLRARAEQSTQLAP
jgi:tetratricopeptide (TPR) repeat protein/tRNA A-37 threonylcarbamoyl transferase component Bud32